MIPSIPIIRGLQFGNPGLQQLQDGDLTDWVAMRNLLGGATSLWFGQGYA